MASSTTASSATTTPAGTGIAPSVTLYAQVYPAILNLDLGFRRDGTSPLVLRHWRPAWWKPACAQVTPLVHTAYVHNPAFLTT